MFRVIELSMLLLLSGVTLTITEFIASKKQKNYSKFLFACGIVLTVVGAGLMVFFLTSFA